MNTGDDVDISEPAVLAWLDEEKAKYWRACGRLPSLEAMLSKFSALRRQGLLEAKYLGSWRDERVAERGSRKQRAGFKPRTSQKRPPWLRLVYSRD